jgi:dihydroorotate dehydrogenase (NAD+) catalytic subunit
MKVDLNGLILKNPVTVASGTFGFGREMSEFFDLGILGGISVKGLTLAEKKGNPAPRIVEVKSGIINSVGLQNPGVETFINDELPFLRQYDTKIIANINGANIDEYARMAERLEGIDIDSIEVNISCPNVKDGGMSFGTNPDIAREVVKQVKSLTGHHIIVKLTPNVTDIKVIAKEVEAAGADAISLVNTFAAMAIDIETQRPILKRRYGGMSGPAIKPLAIKQVYDVYEAVKIPIIGMGGISSGNDAIEFMLAGATAVSIGTYNFINPMVAGEVVSEIEAYLERKNIDDVNKIIGLAHL